MNRIPLAAILASLALTLIPATVTAQAQSQKVTELAPGVFFWQGDTIIRQPANCVWIVLKDYVVVLDANFPWAAREIIEEIKRTTSKPIRFVFNTHYHADHGFGNTMFTAVGATVVSSRECWAESLRKGETDWRSQVLNRGSRPTSTEYDKAVAAETRAKGYTLEHPTLTFEQRMAFDDGEHRVELIQVGPGHTLGDAVAYLPKEKVLVTGDLCVNWPNGNNTSDQDADHEHWVAALDLLASWDVKTVVPGHGRLGSIEVVRGQRAYLADAVSQVRAGIEAGKTVDVLAREVDLTKHQPWGATPTANASAVRAIYRRLSRPPGANAAKR